MGWAEVWLDIKGYNGRYQVSTHGRVRSIDWVIPSRIKGKSNLKKGCLVEPQVTAKGYIQVRLSHVEGRKTRTVHRLVMDACRPNRSKKQVNHIDGVKANNHLTNLEWCTQSENMRHAFKLGLLSRKGSKHSRSKLHEDDIPQIRLLLKTKKQKDIAKKYNVSIHCVSNIHTGKTWSHVC